MKPMKLIPCLLALLLIGPPLQAQELPPVPGSPELRKQNEKLKEDLRKAQARIERLQNELDSTERARNRAEKQAADEANKSVSANAARKAAETELTNANTTRRAAEIELAKAKEAIRRLESQIAATVRSDGDVFRDCPTCPQMVVIPGGRFTMGSPDGTNGTVKEERRGDNEGPQHEVNVPRFALARTEVTAGQFRQFVAETGYRTDAEEDRGGVTGCFTYEEGKWQDRAGRNWQDAGFAQGEDHPAVCVSWNDAQAYVQWLGQKTKQVYRLPSEAEWEYATRVGSKTARPWGDDPDQACAYSNVADETIKRQVSGASNWLIHNCNDGYAYTAPVAHYQPNGFGLFDMIGNAWEWTADAWHVNYQGAPTDGKAWEDGADVKRVLRGGSWGNLPRLARSAERLRGGAANRGVITGFRPARMLP